MVLSTFSEGSLPLTRQLITGKASSLSRERMRRLFSVHSLISTSIMAVNSSSSPRRMPVGKLSRYWNKFLSTYAVVGMHISTPVIRCWWRQSLQRVTVKELFELTIVGKEKLFRFHLSPPNHALSLNGCRKIQRLEQIQEQSER